MRRPWLVTIVAGLETVLAGALAAMTLYVLSLVKKMWPAGTRDFAYGFLVAAVTLAAIAVPVIVSCWGMWRKKSWSWWLAVVVNSFGLVIFLWDPVARGVRPDIDELVFIVLFAVILATLLLPPVRRLFLRKKGKLVEAGTGT